MHPKMRLGLWALVFWGGALSACEDDGLQFIKPTLEVSPEEIDFGVVELGQQKIETVLLDNIQQPPLEIQKVEITDDCGGCFIALNVPEAEIEPFADYDLQIRFRAVRLERATGTLTITSEDPDNPMQTVQLVGEGIDTTKPDICVIPETVDFGFVPSGGVAVSSFVIRSCGTNTLLIDQLSIEPEGAPYRITTSTPTPQNPGELPVDAQASVSLRAELPASSTGTVTARVVIKTNVPFEKNVAGQNGVVHVPLSALGNLPPIAVPGEDQNVEPWSRVALDGSASFDQDDPPDEPLTYRWSFLSTPGGSTTQLERANTPQPSFWADLTGTYEVQLVVIDALGLESEPKVVVIEALPTNVIRIELTWDHPDSDLDLHLIQLGGSFCDCETDVHYRDCGRTPNWFPETPGANPRLDLDDRSGFGPENINVDGHGVSRFIPEGTYSVAVHYFASNAEISSWPTASSNATVRVFVYGLLAAEFTREMTMDNELWVAGRIEWPSGQIVPDDTVVLDAVCGIF